MAEGFEDRQRPPRQSRFPVIADEIVTLSEKVFFPLNDYPGYNFIGKLLGPKGSNLKGLVVSTKTKISILGKGSAKDKSKEEELSKSDDPEHAHYKEPLHVLVQVKAPKITAHRRISQALKELNYYMVPQRDERQEQPDERPAMTEREILRAHGRELPMPLVRAPPPGAVIIDEPPRREARREPPPRDTYASDYYDRPAPERYPETRESQRFSSEREPYRRPEKRSLPPSNGYSPKRYQEDVYDPYAR